LRRQIDSHKLAECFVERINHTPRHTSSNQDVFYKDSVPLTDNGVENWDCPEAIDNDAFLNHLILTKKQNEVGQKIGPNRPKICTSDISQAALDSIKPKVELIAASGVRIILGSVS
jgi:uridine kinase